MTLNCTWIGEPIKITNCHCPSSRKRVWDHKVRSAVLPNVFGLAGFVPFDEWSDDFRAEPLAVILGGDLNLGENSIHNEVKQLQPEQGSKHMVQTLHAGSLVMRHGDFALAQHVRAFQTSSQIGKDYDGISDNHNMVIVVAKMLVEDIMKMYIEEKHSGASEPLGLTVSRDAPEPSDSEERHGGTSEPIDPEMSRGAAELMEGAKEAAESLANLLEDQPKPMERRKARNGYLYTKEQFLAFYGEDGLG